MVQLLVGPPQLVGDLGAGRGCRASAKAADVAEAQALHMGQHLSPIVICKPLHQGLVQRCPLVPGLMVPAKADQVCGCLNLSKSLVGPSGIEPETASL